MDNLIAWHKTNETKIIILKLVHIFTEFLDSVGQASRCFKSVLSWLLASEFEIWKKNEISPIKNIYKESVEIP